MAGLQPVRLCGAFALSSVLLLGGSLLFGNGLLPLDPDHSVQPNAQAAPPLPRANFDTLRTVSRYVFRYTNKTRQERSLPTLRRDSRLAAVACAHNADMFRRDFFQHVNPDGERPHDRVARLHRRLIGGVGENLYEQTLIRQSPKALGQQIVEKWMGSLPHRRNTLRPQFNHQGVCTLHRNDTLRTTQVFAEVSAYLSSPLPEVTSSGERLSVPIAETFPPDATPVQYDFWDAEHDRIVTGPYVFTDFIRIPDTTGTVWSRFYVLETGRYRIQRGPKITITSP